MVLEVTLNVRDYGRFDFRIFGTWESGPRLGQNIGRQEVEYGLNTTRSCLILRCIQSSKAIKSNYGFITVDQWRTSLIMAPRPSRRLYIAYISVNCHGPAEDITQGLWVQATIPLPGLHPPMETDLGVV
ncbi:hypothetical protein TWF106_009100 [Orbilia oligospora]|uniref:Uncharacterized protein n=1 Tax=Orbilia oligospora TaxID=2813651 RepID=A0A6G1MA03_ORBOL|nr:hypothetical protein TWF788_009074 [Orbilia oligospora]KAF3207260.1 hypothetical protein TWF191_001087 [Orbilia oligospora]KAF3216436.1 hypothetical protein TWF679_003051 [Orbilia oligospora]KAF3227583.1 hypothetical protein TWF106_009100 [Orbilia oligospora]KAF3251077.1 hypothetical protein TWF192_005055 [Orbilia oligospora]